MEQVRKTLIGTFDSVTWKISIYLLVLLSHFLPQNLNVMS